MDGVHACASFLPACKMFCRHLRVPLGKSQELGGEAAAVGGTVTRVPLSETKGMGGEVMVLVLKPVARPLQLRMLLLAGTA